MFYLALAFGVVWACHFVYLLVLDGQVRQLRRRLDARAGAPS
jgi:CcmD family protein